MIRIVAVLAALLSLASCAAQPVKGPLAAGVSPDAPKDTLGILLSWTPEQTIENFRHIDRIFPVRTVARGSSVTDLPSGDKINPMVPLGGKRLTVDQVMQQERITGVIALHHGRVVFERYAHGRTAQDRWVSMSAAKSVLSTLVGAAIKDGLIGSIDDSVTRYIPELGPVPAFDGVTLRHLMAMSSGLRWNETYTDLTSDVALSGGAEPIGGLSPIVSYAMKLTREDPPGTVRKYKNMDADLVGIALSRALEGRTLSGYLSEKIWRPAGMEADANWLVDKSGVERGGCCISATLRDFARFGLFIAKGEEGPAGAVLPPGWIEQARAPHWPIGESGTGYGWFWWVRNDTGYEALGAYGQSITIYPEDDVVIAINGASISPGGIGLARYELLHALGYAAIGQPNPADAAN